MRIMLLMATITLSLGAGCATSARAADGDFDPSFGQDGRVRLSWAPGGTWPEAIAIDGNQRIVIAGEATRWGGVPEFMLLRLQPNGVQDLSFATPSDGFFLFDFGLNGIGSGGGNTANAVRVQADGKIVTAGCASAGWHQSHFAILRVTPAGVPDESFGAHGSAHFSAPLTEYNCVEDFQFGAHGRIILGGYTAVPVANDGAVQFNYRTAVAALTPAGALDPGFLDGGISELPFAPQASLSYAAALSVDAQDRIVLAGFTEVAGVLDGAALRLASDGFLDHSFGANGRRLLGVSEGGVHAIQVLSSGATMLAGTGFDNTLGAFVFLARLDDDGDLDTSFGDAGITRFALPATGRVGLLAAMKQGGWLIEAADGSGSGVWLLRTGIAGAPDPGFGNAGVVHAAFDPAPGIFFSATKAVLQSDGKLLVAGNLGGARGNDDLGVMRILADYDTLFADGFDGLP